MRLGELVQVLTRKRVEGSLDVEVAGITHDSRQVKPGDLFVCIRGFKDDGHRYAAEAAAAGAVALVAERKLGILCPLSTVLVPDGREALAWLSHKFYGNPSRHLKVIGVTGTNGKTTVIHLLEAIFARAGHATGLIGTVYNKVGARCYPAAWSFRFVSICPACSMSTTPWRL